jgi:HSP20 family molecular chaperone IbpA
MTATETKTLTPNAGTQAPERAAARKVFMPRVDIYETKDAVFVTADMPGVDEKNVEISLEKSVLTIRGKTESFAPEGYQAAYKEYEEGDFEREFTLTDEVDRDGIQAAMKHGVLKLTLPKAGPAKARKIEVKAN